MVEKGQKENRQSLPSVVKEIEVCEHLNITEYDVRRSTGSGVVESVVLLSPPGFKLVAQLEPHGVGFPRTIGGRAHTRGTPAIVEQESHDL